MANDFFEAMFRRMAVAGLRENNERAVLTAIALHPGVSAAQLARITGLGPQSVSRILVELENEQLILRGEVLRGHRGQPATPISINPEGAYCIGCEIGWRHLTVVLRNLAGEILGEHRREYSFPVPEDVLGQAGEMVNILLKLVPEQNRSRVVDLGLAMPSNIHRNVQLVGASDADAEAWRQLDIAKELERISGLPVRIFNDGNASCWAELIHHAPPRPTDFAYFFIGTFVGAGLVSEGRLWQGITGNSANLGSMLVSSGDGRQEYVHLLASIYALEVRLRRAGLSVPEGDPKNWDWEALEPIVSEWLEAAAFAMAQAVVNTAAMLEIDLAIIDGAMPRKVVEQFIERVRHHCAQLPALTSDVPRIELGSLGSGAAARGASLKPMYRRLFSRDYQDIMSEF